MDMRTLKQVPIYGWVGLGMLLVFWWLNWTLPGLRTNYCFSPMWLGYILLVDALSWARGGQSIIKGKLPSFILMFFLSAPSWWLFELINAYMKNWIYSGTQEMTPFEYQFFMSLAFATVMPSVFASANLFYTFGWVKNNRFASKISKDRSALLRIFISGWVMLVLFLIWPRYFFPVVWLFLIFVIEPINCWLGFRSILDYLSEGDWKPVLALFAGGLICGFLWELWNWYGYPRWTYDIPFVNFWHIFEMPALGYGGYLPFALELFAMYNLMTGLLAAPSALRYPIFEQVGINDQSNSML